MSRFHKPIEKPERQMSFADMAEGLTQREIGGYRNTDPDTSEEAAKALDVPRLEKIILEALRSRPGGLTTREISAVVGIDWGSITPRMKPMAAKGLIYATSERRIWPKSGRSSIVWKAV